jgi:predicted enzyme related to lactoylglutathione lyase
MNHNQAVKARGFCGCPAQERGGSLLYPKKDIGEAGYVAELEDSEGNRIALSQAKD